MVEKNGIRLVPRAAWLATLMTQSLRCHAWIIFLDKLLSKLLKGGFLGNYVGTTIGVIAGDNGDTRSVDFSSNGFPKP